MKKLLFLFIYSALCFASLDKGWEIAKKMDNAAKGYIGEKSEMTLTLIDSNGQKVVREMLGSSIELSKMDRTLMSFTRPADVKGTKLLTWAHDSKDDDQWLYLSSLRRVKRISSRSKGSSFMGSEFTYEDLGGQSIEKYTYNLLGESSIDGQKVWKLERKPKEKSSYTRVILYVLKKELISVKSEYYNKRDELQKSATVEGITPYKVGNKTIYRSKKITMKNFLTKKSSIFEWKNRKIGVKLSARDFTKNALD